MALADAASVAFFLFAGLATAGLAGKAREVLQPKIGTSHAAVIRYTMVLLGGLATILVTLQLFGIAITQLLLGGAFATVLIGIAAQQSLFNVFAGIVLLLARPVNVGDLVSIRSGALGGELRGTVAEIGITYVRLDAPDGPLHLPILRFWPLRWHHWAPARLTGRHRRQYRRSSQPLRRGTLATQPGERFPRRGPDDRCRVTNPSPSVAPTPRCPAAAGAAAQLVRPRAGHCQSLTG